MLNVLITSDDGPEATGLKILQEAVAKCWPDMKPTTIVPEKPEIGTSFSCSPGWGTWEKAPAKETGERAWSLPLTPCDIIYRAFIGRDQFSNRPWDLVLVGVNHGANLGFDVFHSGTIAMAMTAATAFGCAAFAFSQDLPETSHFTTAALDRKLFGASERIVPDFLRKTSPDGGVCWNVNIPQEATLGYKSTKTAHYSRYRKPPTDLVPRARDESSDIVHLEEGFVTITELQLRVNPVLRY